MWNETGVDDKIIMGTDLSVDISLALLVFQMHVTFIVQNESACKSFPPSSFLIRQWAFFPHQPPFRMVSPLGTVTSSLLLPLSN